MLKTKGRLLRLIAVLLTAALVIQVFPMGAYAQEETDSVFTAEDQSGNYVNDSDIEYTGSSEEAEKPFIIEELVGEREIDTKRFKMSDGTNVAAVYDTAVHYLADNEWKDIDNSLCYDVTDNTEGYTNLENDFNVKLAENSAEDYLLKYEKDGGSLRWSLAPDTAEASEFDAASPAEADIPVSADDQTADSEYSAQSPEAELNDTAENEASHMLNETAESESTEASHIKILAGEAPAVSLMSAYNSDDAAPDTLYNEDFSLNNTVTSAAVYENILPNVDITYVISGNILKENITVKEKLDRYDFSFKISASGLELELNPDGSIAAYADGSDGEPVFTVPVPFMYDGNGMKSDTVSFALSQMEDGAYLLTVSADKDWINEEGRAFPVVIDPAITTDQKKSAISANSRCVSSVWPDKVYTNTFWEVGRFYDSGKTTNARTYMNITLPTLGRNDVPVGAVLNLCGTTDFQNTSLTKEVDVRELKEAIPSNVTWKEKPAAYDEVLDFNLVTKQNNRWYYFDVTKAVKKWYGGAAQYGFEIRTTDANEASSENENFKVLYASDWYTDSTNTGSQYRPCLTVAYLNNNGLEDYWTYTSVDAGRGGSASVNNFSGNLVSVQPLLGADGNLMPVSISAIYNSSQNGNAWPGKLGSGWRLNYQMYVSYDSSTAANNYHYYLMDADGTKHYFHFPNGTGSEGEDEDGLGYKFERKASGDEWYVITDKDGGKMVFNSGGLLTKLQDSNENAITVEYAEVTASGVKNNRISTITDGAGRVYSFTYDTSDPMLIKSIKDPAGKSVSFDVSNGALNKITYQDGGYTSYTYSSGVITKFHNIDGTYTTVQYDNTQTRRVTSLAWGTSAANNAKYTFNYGYNETDITDIHGRKVTYQFNNHGQTTAIINNVDGSANFYTQGAPGISSSTGEVNASANKTVEASKTQQPVINYLKYSDFFDSKSISGASGGVFKQVCDNLSGVSFARNSGIGHDSVGSAYIKRSSSNSAYTYYYQDFTVPESGIYTASGYISTNGTQITGGLGAVVRMEKWVSGTQKYGTQSAGVFQTAAGEWERVSVGYSFSKGETIRLLIGFPSGASVGTAYFDDLQLEMNYTVNSRNMLYNSSFEDGLADWTNTSGISVVTADSGLPGGGKAVKYTGSATTTKYFLSQVYINGKKGDVFSFGAWAKADAIPGNGIDRKTGNETTSDVNTPLYSVNLDFIKNGNFAGPTVKAKYNYSSSSWQLMGASAIAPADYDKVQISFNYCYNLNTACFAKPYLYKESFGQSYTYDKDGNVVSAVDQAGSESTFSSKNDQLSRLTDPSGSSFFYGYDDKKNLTTALTTSGQRYAFDYDTKGNAESAQIFADKYAASVADGKTYYIRNMYSGNALDCGAEGIGSVIKNYTFTPKSSNQKWTLVSAGNGYYYLKVNEYYLGVKNGSNTDGATLVNVSTTSSYAQKLKFEQNDDGSFTIKTSVSGYDKVLDGQPGDSKDTRNNSPVQQYTAKADDRGQKWYLFEVNNVNDASSTRIETKAETSADFNFTTSVTDAAGNKTNYQYNTSTGQLTRQTDPLGNMTNYVYDSMGRVTSVNSFKVVSNKTGFAYTYDSNDRLTAIKDNAGISKYTFTYDDFGRNTEVAVSKGTSALHTLVENEYNSKNLLTKVFYANGSNAEYTYDELDRLTLKKYNDSAAQYEYTYDLQSRLAEKYASLENETTYYSYDLAGRLTDAIVRNGSAFNGTMKRRTQYEYDEKNRLKGTKYTFSDIAEQAYEAVFGNATTGQDAGRVYSLNLNGSRIVAYTYDGFGRLTGRRVGPSAVNASANLTTSYTYAARADSKYTTTLVKRMRTGSTFDYTYAYDANSRITSVTDGNSSTKTTYAYDNWGRLTRANDPLANVSTTYSYDKYGNIESKSYYPYTTGSLGTANDTITYTYGSTYWRDQLTSYDGETITYDAVGNPLKWRDGMSFTWMAGRQMNSTKLQNGKTYGYEYNEDGIRYSKWEYGGLNTTYYLDGSTIIAEKNSQNTIIYKHDENGRYVGFNLNGTDYYYVYNAQGDVMGIVNASGTIVARYTYDPWGKVLAVRNVAGAIVTSSTHVGNINPIRYRGYYYDAETGLYYLNSRYYDPEVGRFVNSDDILPKISQYMQDYNLYAYCEDDPVNKYDPEGHTSYGADKYTGKYVTDMYVNCTGITDPYVAKAMAEFGIRYVPGYIATAGQEGRIAQRARELYIKDHTAAEYISNYKKNNPVNIVEKADRWISKHIEAAKKGKSVSPYTLSGAIGDIPVHELIPEISYGDEELYAYQSMRRYWDEEYIRIYN